MSVYIQHEDAHMDSSVVVPNEFIRIASNSPLNHINLSLSIEAYLQWLIDDGYMDPSQDWRYHVSKAKRLVKLQSEARLMGALSFYIA